MADTRQPEQADDAATPFVALVKTAALAATATWVLVLLTFLSAMSGGGSWNVLGPLLALVVMTPIFFIFVLPALLFSFLGGVSGAKAGACLLAGGVLVATIVMFGGPILRMIS